MVNSIDQALVIQFQDQVHIEAAQAMSRLRGKVIEKPVRGNEYAYERLDNGGLPIEITERHAATTLQEVAHTRRQIKMRDFAETLGLDAFDDLQVLIDPTREYARAVAVKMMRQYDKLVIDAVQATVNTGRNFGTPITAANDGVTTIVNGGIGLTYEKLLTVKENFINNEVGVDAGEKEMILITGQQHSDLMKEIELTSGDFVRDFFIEGGEIKKALGMEVITFGTGDTEFLSATGGVRDCIALTSRAVCVGVNQDIKVQMDNRPDLNNMQQVQARFFLGAVRTEGALTQVVECTEA